MDSPTGPITEFTDPPEIASDVLVSVPGCVPFVIKADHGTPPPHVLAQVAAAARIHERMSARGRELSFGRSADGMLAIELHEGSRSRRLTLDEACALACGETAL